MTQDTLTAPAPLIETYQPGELVFSVSHWTHAFFGPKWPIEKFCEIAVPLKLQMDHFLDSDAETYVQQHEAIRNLCVVPDAGPRLDDQEGNYDPFDIGFNSPQFTDRVKSSYRAAIDKAAANKIPFVIVFTGMNDEALKPEAQIENLVTGLRDTAEYAATKGVIANVEMLNTRIATPMMGHPGYFGDNTDLVAKIVKEVNHPNLGIALDLYHMTIMGENLAGMITKYASLVKYVHLAGAFAVSEAPDTIQRAELTLPNQRIGIHDALTQLKDAGFGGPVSFEWVPTTDDTKIAVARLQDALRLCGV